MYFFTSFKLPHNFFDHLLGDRENSCKWLYFVFVPYTHLCVQDLQFIYIIPKNLSIVVIIVMLMLNHINIAFRFIQFFSVHFNPFSSFVLFQSTSVHLVHFCPSNLVHSRPLRSVQFTSFHFVLFDDALGGEVYVKRGAV